MYASYIEIQTKPGQQATLVAAVREKLPEIARLSGVKQLVSVDLGNDLGVTLVIYESQADQEAAAPKAQEILGGMAQYYAAAPERKGCEVVMNESF